MGSGGGGGGGEGVRGKGDIGSRGGGGGVRGGGDLGSGGDLGLSIDPVDDPLNDGVLHPGIWSGDGLSTSRPCFVITSHNWFTSSVQSGLEGFWLAMFIDQSATGSIRFCNAAVPLSVPSASVRPPGFSRTATGAPNTRLTTWLMMKKVRKD